MSALVPLLAPAVVLMGAVAALPAVLPAARNGHQLPGDAIDGRNSVQVEASRRVRERWRRCLPGEHIPIVEEQRWRRVAAATVALLEGCHINDSKGLGPARLHQCRADPLPHRVGLNTAITCQEHESRIGARTRCHRHAQRQRDGQPHGCGNRRGPRPRSIDRSIRSASGAPLLAVARDF